MALFAGLLLAGCGGQANGLDLQTPAPQVSRSAAPVAERATPTPTTAPPTTPPATTVPPAQTEEQKVLAAYTAYYDALQPISAMSAADRPAALAKLTVDPLYSTALKELAARDAADKIVYGKLVVHPRVALLRNDNAALEDCQDASKFGLMNRTTGEKLTVGVAEFKQLTEVKRGQDGVWRLSTVGHTPEAKC